MGQQETVGSEPAAQEAAAACLKHYFDQHVAEAMPSAIGHALSGPVVITGWLYRAAAVHSCAHFGPLDEDADLLFVASLSVPTLLVLLLDKRQPAAVTLAARDALQAHFLADTHVAQAIREDAAKMARRAVRHLVQQRQMERAEEQSLYGREHSVPDMASAAVAQAGRVLPALCAFLVALTSGIALVLAACGGGGSSEEPEPRPQVDCKAHPEQCK